MVKCKPNPFLYVLGQIEDRNFILTLPPRVGWENSLAMLAYSSHLRAYRKNFHAILGSKQAVARFNSLQDIEVRRFLLRVLEKPDDLSQHIRT